MADIGLVGLGVMGANLALNMAEKGYSVAVYNRTASKTDAFVAEAGNLAPASDRLRHTSRIWSPPSRRRARSSSWCRPARRSTKPPTCSPPSSPTATC